MSINYRKTDPNAVGAQVMKERAQELEHRAFAMETEVECCVYLLEIEPTSGELVLQLEAARKDATKLRRAAVRAAGAAPLTAEEIKTIHHAFFNGNQQTGNPGWLASLEQTHAGRIALINEANRQLGLKGIDALAEDEKAEMEEGRDSLLKEIDRLENRHCFCLEAMERQKVEVIEVEDPDGLEGFDHDHEHGDHDHAHSDNGTKPELEVVDPS